MAGTFTASVRNWSEKAKRNAEFVVRGAIQDVTEQMSRRVEGITLGGAFVEGYVPVGKTSGLVNSLGFALNGPVSATGGSYTATLAGMDLGDTFTAAFTIEYARHVEYGRTTSTGKHVPGRFFVRNAVQQWEAFVAANAAKFGD